jgi:hypothetical protein
LVQGEYVEFTLVDSDDGSTHEFHVGEVSGIKGGKLMCETRNETRVSQSQHRASSVSEPNETRNPKETRKPKETRNPKETSEPNETRTLVNQILVNQRKLFNQMQENLGNSETREPKESREPKVSSTLKPKQKGVPVKEEGEWSYVSRVKKTKQTPEVKPLPKAQKSSKTTNEKGTSTN